MMLLLVWLPGPMFLLGVSLCLVSCSFQRVSVGGSVSRGSLSRMGVSVTETPLYGEERVVHILLECFLVEFKICLLTSTDLI